MQALVLLLLSLAVSLLVLVVFRFTSNQKAISRAKDRVFAHLLELRLFPDDPRTTLKSLGQLLIWNGRYLFASLRPALVLALPVTLLMVHLARHYEWRPLRVGEATTVTVQLADGVDVADLEPTLNARGVDVETAPVRVRSDQVVSWRVRGLEPGLHTLDFVLGSERLQKNIRVGSNPGWVTPRRVRGLWHRLWNPGEAALRARGVEWIEIDYPAADRVQVFGYSMHWITYLLLTSFLGVIVLRRPLRVEI